MISAAGRVGLAGTPTLQILGRRLWGRTARSNFVRHINHKSIAAHHLPAASATFGIARYSSEAPAAQLENDDASESMENGDELTDSTSLNVEEDGVLPDDGESSEDLVVNEQNNRDTTEEASTDCTDGLVVDGNGATTEDDEPAASDDADSADTISKKSQSTDDNINDLSVIRTGVIQWLDYPKKCAVFIQDPQFQKISPNGEKRVHIHFNYFYPKMTKEFRQNTGSEWEKFVKPIIYKERRFQFQAKPQQGSRDLQGFNLRYEGGGDIPMLRWADLLVFILKAKSTLGHEIYDILSKEKDVNAITKKVNKALELCKKRVRWAQNQVKDPEKAMKDCKAELGEEIHELMTNIAIEDNVEKKAEKAYLRCLSNLLALDIIPNEDMPQLISQRAKLLAPEDRAGIQWGSNSNNIK